MGAMGGGYVPDVRMPNRDRVCRRGAFRCRSAGRGGVVSAPHERDLSKAKRAEAFFPGVTINARQPSGPYLVRCQRCKGWQQRAASVGAAVGAASAHFREHERGVAG
jgi:hypothetical protein